ncbi:RBBP9/YdeN family alpha/beta hydrolase [Paenibacillus piri]|uniref:Serine hydrolase family protein n=1 Tax=Paenibacillus piri TaxID=2547395 RepID=A0A4R5KHA3_9BACL|nr:alpha/beta hydrolase [Paenibacillus piri]TDF94801.1 serine hydrolase family protein [Paenibacillus piri]
MSKQVLFVHSAGAQGRHQGSGELVASLQNALGESYRVSYPIMPNPERPSYKPWKLKLAEELAEVQNEVILVGHSLGGSVLLKYFSEENCTNAVAGLFLVATPYWGKDPNWQVDDFLLREQFATKLTAIPRMFIYHSRDDEVVPIEHALRYAESIPQAAVHVLDRCGHAFKAGLPQLVEDIKSL